MEVRDVDDGREAAVQVRSGSVVVVVGGGGGGGGGGEKIITGMEKKNVPPGQYKNSAKLFSLLKHNRRFSDTS